MSENTKKIIGNRIRYLRTHNGYTQEGLAEKLGLKGKSSIANYESGNISPSDSVKLQLCNLFNCSMDYLMGKSDFHNKKQLLNTLSDKIFDQKVIIRCLDKLTKIGLNYSQSKNFIKDIIYIRNEYEFDYETQINNYISNYNQSLQTKLFKFMQDFNNDLTFIIRDNDILFLNRINGEMLELSTFHSDPQYYMCPVYGQISAGQPNWVEENIEGRLPIDTELMGIINPEEHFFLRVNGESMNNVVKNGAFALIHKQDMVEDGEIAVILVNGYDATLKRFTKKGDVVVLEPDSTDSSFKTQIYDKTTPIKILGKYVGKMEINN